MILNFYDKNFIPLQNNASLNVGFYSITKSAIDFDDFSVTSEAFVEDINPTFVIIRDDRGRYIYGAFAGIPSLNENNQTKLQASDLKTIFNSDIVGRFNETFRLSEYLEQVFSLFNNQCIKGTFNINYDISEVEQGIQIENLLPPVETGCYNVWNDLLVPYLKYYDLYITSNLDVKNKAINFKIGRIATKQMPLKLWEFNISNYGKYIAATNEVQAVVNYNGNLVRSPVYLLLSNNAITTNESLRDLYPIKKKQYYDEAQSQSEAQTKLKELSIQGIQELVNSRFNESIEINTQNKKELEDIDFGTTFIVYAEKGVFYKQLPLGKITISSDAPKKLVIGYKPDSLLFYF